MTASASDPPIACTLATSSMEERLAEWQALLEQVRSRSSVDAGGLRLELGRGVDVAQVARLAAAEQACCSFFSFAITVDARGIGLEVRAPEDAIEVVTALFGDADSGA